MERLRARGIPTNAAELRKRYAIAEGQADITALWLEAIEPFDTPDYVAASNGIPIVGTEGEVPLPGEPWPEEGPVEQFLARTQPTLDLLHHAAAQEGEVRFPVKYEDGMSALLPHVQKLRGAARLLQLDAQRCAWHGDVPGTTRAMHGMFRAAASLDDEPVLISQLVRNAIQGMACRELARSLPHVSFTPDDLKLLRQDLAAAQSRVPMQQAWSGERVLGMTAFHDPQAAREMHPGRLGVHWAFIRGDDLISYLQVMAHMEAAAAEPWPAALAEVQKAEQEVKTLAGSGLDHLRHPLTLLFVPAGKAAFQAGARNDAMLAAADTAIAIELFRRQHGQLPAKLAELVPRFLDAVPTDPFDGQPLRYLLQPNEYRIYSIGTNGKDDGGLGDEKNLADIVLRVQLPASMP